MANKKIFPNLPEQERKEIQAKIFHAMTVSNEAYYDIVRAVEHSERQGHFKDVKFFNSKIYEQK